MNRKQNKSDLTGQTKKEKERKGEDITMLEFWRKPMAKLDFQNRDFPPVKLTKNQGKTLYQNKRISLRLKKVTDSQRKQFKRRRIKGKREDSQNVSKSFLKRHQYIIDEINICLTRRKKNALKFQKRKPVSFSIINHHKRPKKLKLRVRKKQKIDIKRRNIFQKYLQDLKIQKQKKKLKFENNNDVFKYVINILGKRIENNKQKQNPIVELMKKYLSQNQHESQIQTEASPLRPIKFLR